MKHILMVVALSCLGASLFAQRALNAARIVKVADVCQAIKITQFAIQNADKNGELVVKHNYKFKSQAAEGVLAIELVVLEYGPFDDDMRSTKYLITPGKGDYALMPGAEESATAQWPFKSVTTAIAFVGAIRFESGKVWKYDPKALVAAVKLLAPHVTVPL